MVTLDMKPEVLAAHFWDLVAMTDFPVRSPESDATTNLRVKQSYRLSGDLIVMATYDIPSQCTKIVLKQKQLHTIVMAGRLDDLTRMIHLGRQWFTIHPDAASMVPAKGCSRSRINVQRSLAVAACLPCLRSLRKR